MKSKEIYDKHFNNSSLTEFTEHIQASETVIS
jgi:hypothetical protein